MERTQFALLYRLDGCERYLLWFSSDVDGLATNEDGSIPSFENLESLRAYALVRNLEIQDETPKMHDLDRTETWVENGATKAVDFENLLEAWNLFADVSRTVGQDFDSEPDKTNALYRRIFFGSDTANSVLRPKSEPIFKPRLTDTEVLTLQMILKSGLEIFRGVVQSSGTDYQCEAKSES